MQSPECSAGVLAAVPALCTWEGHTKSVWSFTHWSGTSCATDFHGYRLQCCQEGQSVIPAAMDWIGNTGHYHYCISTKLMEGPPRCRPTRSILYMYEYLRSLS